MCRGAKSVDIDTGPGGANEHGQCRAEQDHRQGGECEVSWHGSGVHRGRLLLSCIVSMSFLLHLLSIAKYEDLVSSYGRCAHYIVLARPRRTWGAPPYMGGALRQTKQRYNYPICEPACPSCVAETGRAACGVITRAHIGAGSNVCAQGGACSTGCCGAHASCWGHMRGGFSGYPRWCVGGPSALQSCRGLGHTFIGHPEWLVGAGAKVPASRWG